MSSSIQELGRGLMSPSAGTQKLRPRKTVASFDSAIMQPTLPSIDSALGQRRDSPNAPPANTRVNSGSSSPIGGADHIRIVAVLQGHFPSPSPTPSNTRAASPQRGASIRPHTAGEATEMMDKLGDLAVERRVSRPHGFRLRC
jgi:hypothetical protein